MVTKDYPQLHAELGFAFTEFAVTHPDSPLLRLLDDEPLVVFQCADPELNAFELEHAQVALAHDDRPERPVVLIHVSIPDSADASGVDWNQAKVLGKFVMRPLGSRTEESVGV